MTSILFLKMNIGAIWFVVTRVYICVSLNTVIRLESAKKSSLIFVEHFFLVYNKHLLRKVKDKKFEFELDKN